MGKGQLLTTFEDIVLEYFPTANWEDIDYILWEKTGFPTFWQTKNTKAELRKQLQEFKDSLALDAYEVKTTIE